MHGWMYVCSFVCLFVWLYVGRTFATRGVASRVQEPGRGVIERGDGHSQRWRFIGDNRNLHGVILKLHVRFQCIV